VELPDSWTIHPAFNIDLLEYCMGEDPKKQVIEIKPEGEDWAMETIIARGPSDDNLLQHRYLVKWMGIMCEDNTWERYLNMANNNLRLCEEYYVKNPAMVKDGSFKEIAKEKKIRRNKLSI
jgi:hypothetical protein